MGCLWVDLWEVKMVTLKVGVSVDLTVVTKAVAKDELWVVGMERYEAEKRVN